ncbi:MAG: hypothetical protein HND47_22110 [Chloroflexi bacterium]|nr:hypothetical protein [Chloroflexota bacterium]
MHSSPEPARLLVVDDNKVNRMMLSRHLELQGHLEDNNTFSFIAPTPTPSPLCPATPTPTP